MLITLEEYTENTIYHKLMKRNQKILTCIMLDLETTRTLTSYVSKISLDMHCRP